MLSGNHDVAAECILAERFPDGKRGPNPLIGDDGPASIRKVQPHKGPGRDHKTKGAPQKPQFLRDPDAQAGVLSLRKRA